MTPPWDALSLVPGARSGAERGSLAFKDTLSHVGLTLLLYSVTLNPDSTIVSFNYS